MNCAGGGAENGEEENQSSSLEGGGVFNVVRYTFPEDILTPVEYQNFAVEGDVNLALPNSRLLQHYRMPDWGPDLPAIVCFSLNCDFSPLYVEMGDFFNKKKDGNFLN